MDENEWGEGFPTITSLFIPISLPRKLYGASAQNNSNSVSAEILSTPNFITLYIYPETYTSTHKHIHIHAQKHSTDLHRISHTHTEASFSVSSFD